MAKFVMFVQSQAKPGRDDEYNRWYDASHLPEMLAVPGVTGGRRLKTAMTLMGAPPLAYASIYEIEADDVGAFLAAMGQHNAQAGTTDTDALDRDGAILWFFEQYEPAA